jgi:hypothetical protein
MADDQNDEIIENIKNAERQIISKLGFEDAPEDKKASILKSIDSRVAVALTKVMLEKASPEESEMIKLALQEGGNLESKVAEIVQKNPALQEEIRKALADLWEKILKESEAVRG